MAGGHVRYRIWHPTVPNSPNEDMVPCWCSWSAAATTNIAGFECEEEVRMKNLWVLQTIQGYQSPPPLPIVQLQTEYGET
mmetsp:Transcript_45266/g.73802  ORF Transcript_45266/g.73802 Transcript_45266/m.73802 type:complete len:80 (-) Transcript_45266:310-549(-)